MIPIFSGKTDFRRFRLLKKALLLMFYDCIHILYIQNFFEVHIHESNIDYGADDRNDDGLM